MNQKILERYPDIKFPVTLAKVDNQYTSLGDSVPSDSSVDFVDISDAEGSRTYERTLVFLLDYLFKKKNVTIKIEHSYGNALFGRFLKGKAELSSIKKEIKNIIIANKDIEKMMLPKLEAMYYLSDRDDDISILRNFAVSHIPVYNIDGFSAYFAGPLLPNTSFLSTFDLKSIKEGFLLVLPSKDNPGSVSKVEKRKKLFNTYREAQREAEILKIWDVSQLNQRIIEGKISEILKIAEVIHSEKITAICKKIVKKKQNIQAIFVAGPSSSGKTTFSKRLGMHFRLHGIDPIYISLDDYFFERDKTPYYKDGTHFFDAFSALDIDLFQAHIDKLLKGEKVERLYFNFKTGKRGKKGENIELGENSMLIIEGLHSFNPDLTGNIPLGKFLIYVSPLTQLNINRVNRIPTRDVRLLRRIFRDTRFRGNSAEHTLQKWESVKDGENQFVFPYQERADVMFNSSLVYELAVLKVFLETPLRCVSTSSPYYCEALRLLNFLDHFLNIPEKEIPQTSILREFIGGSTFLY